MRKWILLLILLGLTSLAGCSHQPQSGDNRPVHNPATSESVQPEEDDSGLSGRVNVLPADEATVVAYPVGDDDDPWMSFNRTIYGFNDFSYRYAMIPVANHYNRLPEPLILGVRRFFSNLKSPQLIANHLLQGNVSKAANSLLRFVINTTIGIAGIFDPAQTQLSLQPQVTGFSDTLQHYGTGSGPFVMLPLLGPADLRSSAGFIVDVLLNPVPYLTTQPTTTIINAVDIEQVFAQQAERYSTLRDKAEDPYQYFRNAWLQRELRDQQYKTVDTYLE